MTERDVPKPDEKITDIDELNLALLFGTSGISVMRPKPDKDIEDRVREDILHEKP